MADKIKVPKPSKIYKSPNLTVEIRFPISLEQRLNNDFGMYSPFSKFWDNMVLTGIEPYVPMATGELKRSGETYSILGSGELVYRTPYARYLWYGKVMAGTPRRATTKDLVFTTSVHPLAGSFWAIRAKNDQLPSWVRSAQAFINRKYS